MSKEEFNAWLLGQIKEALVMNTQKGEHASYLISIYKAINA